MNSKSPSIFRKKLKKLFLIYFLLIKSLYNSNKIELEKVNCIVIRDEFKERTQTLNFSTQLNSHKVVLQLNSHKSVLQSNSHKSVLQSNSHKSVLKLNCHKSVLQSNSHFQKSLKLMLKLFWEKEWKELEKNYWSGNMVKEESKEKVYYYIYTAMVKNWIFMIYFYFIFNRLHFIFLIFNFFFFRLLTYLIYFNFSHKNKDYVFSFAQNFILHKISNLK